MKKLAAVLALFLCFGCIDIDFFGPKANIMRLENETGVRTIEGKDWGVMDELGGLGEDQIFQNMEWEQENITVVYFYGSNCSACKALEQWFIQEKLKYNDSVTWVNINVDNASGWSEYLKFADGYDVPLKERYVPMVYVGNSYGWGIDGIRNNMGVWISECQQNGCYSPYEMLK